MRQQLSASLFDYIRDWSIIEHDLRSPDSVRLQPRARSAPTNGNSIAVAQTYCRSFFCPQHYRITPSSRLWCHPPRRGRSGSSNTPLALRLQIVSTGTRVE